MSQSICGAFYHKLKWTVVLLLLLTELPVQAQEARCTALNVSGSTCVCSEPLQATSYPENVANDFKNPNDTSTLQCSQDGVTGGAITRTADDVVASSDSAALAALPSGNTVARFVRASNDHQGTFMVGSNTAVSGTFVRLAARWYIYHTPTYDFKLEATCENSKISELSNGALIDYTTPNFHTYNYLTWSPSVDCCVSGPGPSNNVTSSTMKGKWWRWEVVMTNRSGPNFQLEMFGKNITDGSAEIQMIRLSDNGSVSHETPPGIMSVILSNNHRFSSAGSCRGWIGISHYMMAGWTTNAGQRIGAATEVEGGGGGPAVPSAPTGFNVAELKHQAERNFASLRRKLWK
jgi:hypothetical protein